MNGREVKRFAFELQLWKLRIKLALTKPMGKSSRISDDKLRWDRPLERL